MDLQVPLETKEQIDREVVQFIAAVEQVADESKPPDHGNTRWGISYPVEVKELVLAKRSAQRKWQQSRYPGNKTISIQ